MYNEEIMTVAQLEQKIVLAFRTIKEEASLEITTTEVRRRFVKCTEMQGSHFEHLLLKNIIN